MEPLLKVTYTVSAENLGTSTWVDYTQTAPNKDSVATQFRTMIEDAQSWRRGTNFPDYAFERHLTIEEIGRLEYYTKEAESAKAIVS